MQITQAMSFNKEAFSSGHRFTQEQLWQEFRYIQAEKVTRGLLEKGLITQEEYGKIMAQNRRTFPTYLSPIF